ncbi:methionine ABC transporter permease [Wohlfahrtiimonas chitiniclastica]|uniref:methionine ABC transporter permease n=1 Tax=Wohlfahrtiimonas chitiniclastica TaxID=400946 RepID=UPI001BD18EDB|nr:ABC transporter permease [Wohlfahrtiimonas chitiniclastica]MBS7817113.1 ABC transporter permease [Wohlfahrtiimonas chitiniclastica]MBS7823032.1 ABC transporter permease [Wohlfahrtiimonas chitiniclastica]MBS7830846.1 ABC transporter permease [Wohlfahrtiimonas chitiniclastica]MBS7832814.1 ABC transporter permease [Wohlfahrtiimonas chitiniclastica]
MRRIFMEQLTAIFKDLFIPHTVGLEGFILAGQQTLWMVVVSLVLGVILGGLLGIILVLTRPNGIRPHRAIYNVLNPIINIVRSLPFIILLVAVMPITRIILDVGIGTSAAIIPLTIYIAPFIARLVETSLLEVDHGIIEAANAMGASTFETVWHFLIPEAKASLILNFTTATIGLIGATAMAGAIGAGGIGDLAINYGYNRYDNAVIVYCVIILVVLVQAIQMIGNYFAKRVRS